MAAEGSVPGQSAEPVLNYAEDKSDEKTARIKLSFKDKRTHMRNGVMESVYSKDKLHRKPGIYQN